MFNLENASILSMQTYKQWKTYRSENTALLYRLFPVLLLYWLKQFLGTSSIISFLINNFKLVSPEDIYREQQNLCAYKAVFEKGFKWRFSFYIYNLEFATFQTQRKIWLFMPPPHRGGSIITYLNYYRKGSLDYDCSGSTNKMDSVLFPRWQSMQLNHCRLWKRGTE